MECRRCKKSGIKQSTMVVLHYPYGDTNVTRKVCLCMDCFKRTEFQSGMNSMNKFVIC